jgi:hypothetical protein
VPDLTGVPALDLAIGLSFVFFLLATLALAVQELIASVFGLRARTLEQGLRSLLEDPEKGWKYVDEFYDHDLVRSLYKTPPPAVLKPPKATAAVQESAVGRNAHVARRGWFKRAACFFWPTAGPSYVSPRAFAVVLLDTIAPGEPEGDPVAHIQKKVDGLPEVLKKRLQPLLKEAGNDRDQIRTNIEAWYDDAMARVSGWYKRKTQIMLLVIGVVLVVAVNANTVRIGERLWTDHAVRSAVVAQAAATPQAGRTAADAGDVATAAKQLGASADSVAAVGSLGIPLGWSDATKPSWDGAGDWAVSLLGWLLTIAAISLGAPFWFDALGRISRLRSSGKPETPLPASGSGKPNERIRTLPIPASVEVQVAPAKDA